MPKRHSYQHGFTLMEILVALTILAIALAAVITLASNQALNTTHLRDKTLAHWVAMNKITELQLSDEWPAKGEKEGKEQMGLHEWYWVRTITETPDERVRQVDIAVYLDKQDERPVTNLISFLSQPL
ncbi:MAG: type II secretion system minor pseudopilin GspI [Chromatiales bacterium]|jgi:general secretion pathway protein I